MSDVRRAVCLLAHGGPEAVAVQSIAAPPPRRSDETIVRMRAGGLNRVDLYMRESGANITHRLPMNMGLDGADVVEAPADGPRFKAGDPVIVYPLRACGACEFCRRGDGPLCVLASYMGEHEDGLLSEQDRVPEANLLVKPICLSRARRRSASLGSRLGA